MSTINYRTSDYITLAIKPYDPERMKQDPDFMQQITSLAREFNTTVDEEITLFINGLYEADTENAKTILSDHPLYYYHIRIRPGYYEGLSIDIENNFPVAYDCYDDKRAAQREITEIKKLLNDLAGGGFVACFPGYCTGYCDYAETINLIDDAIRAMRDETKTIPTWRQYERAGV